VKRLVTDWLIALVLGVGVYLGAAWMLAPGPVTGPAPGWTLPDTAGTRTSLSQWRGKVVVLNFWGSWCPPCREEIPGFRVAAEAEPEAQFVGLAVRSGSGDALRRAAEALGITWPVVEADAAVLEAYAVDVYPTTFVLKPDGTIAARFVGRVEGRELRAAIDAARR
jgi:cytochrome c biogenesis protein CcmG/thiol:disulfide interchange protein DsbE